MIAPLSLWLIDVALRCVIRPFLLYRVTVIDARAIDPNGDCDVGALVPVATAHFVADDLELEGDGEGDGLRGGKALAMEMTTVKSSKAVGASGSGSGSGGASSGGSSSVSSIGCHISRLTLDVAGFPHDFEPGSYCFLNIPKCSVRRHSTLCAIGIDIRDEGNGADSLRMEWQGITRPATHISHMFLLGVTGSARCLHYLSSTSSIRSASVTTRR